MLWERIFVSVFNYGFMFCDQNKDFIKRTEFCIAPFVLAWKRTVRAYKSQFYLFYSRIQAVCVCTESWLHSVSLSTLFHGNIPFINAFEEVLFLNMARGKCTLSCSAREKGILAKEEFLQHPCIPPSKLDCFTPHWKTVIAPFMRKTKQKIYLVEDIH